jgi:CRP-like cAMP-binding protein
MSAKLRRFSTAFWHSPAEVAAGRQPAAQLWRLTEPANDEQDWLLDALAPLSVRLRLAPEAQLFAVGDPARRYYLVESGKLLVHRHGTHLRRVVRMACDGDLLIYGCGGVHAASCHAVEPSMVLAIERLRMERAAGQDSLLAGVLRRMHAGELTLLLRSPGATPLPSDVPPGLRSKNKMHRREETQPCRA